MKIKEFLDLEYRDITPPISFKLWVFFMIPIFLFNGFMSLFEKEGLL